MPSVLERKRETEKAALAVISSSRIAHNPLIMIFLSRYLAQVQMPRGTRGPVDAGVSAWRLTPQILPVVEPAELWEQRSAASALLWERSLLLGPKPSERRKYSNKHLLSVCNTGESGILSQTFMESLPPSPEVAVPLLSPPVSPPFQCNLQRTPASTQYPEPGKSWIHVF